MGPLQPGDELEIDDVTPDFNTEMEVEGPEGQVVSLEEAADKEVCGPESTPGIVPDGKSDFDNEYNPFSEENVSIQ